MTLAGAVRSSRPLQAFLALGALVLVVGVLDVMRLLDARAGCMDWQGTDSSSTGCDSPTWSIVSEGGLAWYVLAFDALLLGVLAVMGVGIAVRWTILALAGTLAIAVAPFFLASRGFVFFYPLLTAAALATTLLLYRQVYGGRRKTGGAT